MLKIRLETKFHYQITKSICKFWETFRIVWVIYYIYISILYIYIYSILCTQLLTHVKVYETVKGASFRTHIFQSIWMSSILGHAEYRVHKPLPNGIYGIESTIKKGFGVPLLLHLQPKNYNQCAAIQRNFVLISFLKNTLCFLDNFTVYRFYTRKIPLRTWLFCLSSELPYRPSRTSMKSWFWTKLWTFRGGRKIDRFTETGSILSWENQEGNVDIGELAFPKQIWWKMVGF